MAAGLSTHWRKDGPTSRTAQARYLAQQVQAACANVAPAVDGSRRYCPQHAFRGCPHRAA